MHATRASIDSQLCEIQAPGGELEFGDGTVAEARIASRAQQNRPSGLRRDLSLGRADAP
jgi:hypothetical protein